MGQVLHRVLPGPVALQFLKVVARRKPEIQKSYPA